MKKTSLWTIQIVLAAIVLGDAVYDQRWIAGLLAGALMLTGVWGIAIDRRSRRDKPATPEP
jgi:hypothetical protein